MQNEQNTAAILERYPAGVRENLIAILQDVQESQGALSRTAIIAIARHLGLAAGKVYGVATFYNQFRFENTGKYHIILCRGTACHVKGSAAILDFLERYLRIHPGDTTADGLFSLGVSPCLGACGLAPVMSINGEIHACVNEDKIRDIISAIRDREGREA